MKKTNEAISINRQDTETDAGRNRDEKNRKLLKIISTTIEGNYCYYSC